MRSRPIQIVAGVVVALVLFGAGFYAGTTRAQASTAAGPAASPAAAAGGRGAFGGAAGNAGAAGAANRNVVNGQILSVNADSITIQVRAAGQQGASPTTTSQLILVGPTTRVVKTTETDVKLADLKAGDQITIAGTPDATTGSVSAQAIVLGGNNVLADLLGGGAAGGARRASPSPSPTR
ncbi:MAG TPA: hypothetical protein VM070_08790 [Candidatus Saccharimonadales bacterium]|nr:hypothetical protein [Candidatus Saccharimonadales bacterium]